MSSSFDLYQFFLNTDDRDAKKYLLLFTFLAESDIAAVMEGHTDNPEARQAQKKLAEEVTKIVHGTAGLAQAEAASASLFGKIELASQSADELAQLGTTMPTIELPAAVQSERSLTDIAATGKLFGSRKEAKRSIKAGGFYVNDVACSGDGLVADADVLHGKFTVLRKGKKSHLMIRWTA